MPPSVNVLCFFTCIVPVFSGCCYIAIFNLTTSAIGIASILVFPFYTALGIGPGGDSNSAPCFCFLDISCCLSLSYQAQDNEFALAIC